MIGRIRIRYHGAVPGAGMGKREFGQKVLKPGFYKMGRHWHANFAKKHFTHAGAREYGYYKRKGDNLTVGSKRWKRSYAGQKWRKKGHNLPLVFKGEARRLSRMANIVANSKGVKVKLTKLNKLNFRNPKSRINMRAEMTRVSTAEAEVLTRQGDEEMGRRITVDASTSTVTIK